MGSIGMVQVKSAQEVSDEMRQEMEERNAFDTQQFDLINSLSKFVSAKWEDARRAKEDVEQSMLQSCYQRQGKYDPKKLAAIVASKQPEIFMNITDTKCRNATAWVKDILFGSPLGRIFGVDPTTIPELPEHITTQIQSQMVQKYIDMAVQDAMQSGEQLPTEMLREVIVQHIEEIKAETKKAIDAAAKELAQNIEDKIEDDFEQGGFYAALLQAIDDIIALKIGIIKGPIFRKEKIRKTALDANGKIIKTVSEKIVPQYERRSPFCIFPSPRSTGVDSGYLFDVLTVRPRDLYNLIGVDGYDEKALRDVLRGFHSGTLKNDWLGLSQDSLEGMGEESATQDKSQYPEEKIYCLELCGDVPGELLREWGIDGIDDDDAEYSCCVWKIGDHIVKAMLNYDQMGRKPYFKTSCQAVNDSFWGEGIPEKIADCQQVCNACARSILSNVGLGSLPQIGLNVDRLEANSKRELIPGKIWPFTDEQMASSIPPIIFFQPTMVTEKLINVYVVFSKIADEHSGIPAYAHGDSQVGGAGNTASGLHQLIQSASRGIKSIIRNIDTDIIAKCVQYHYDYLLDNYEIYGLFGDYHIRARGSEALVAMEQQTSRKIEFLANTANPIDIQLVGAENRRKTLFAVAENLGIELDEEAPMMQQQPQTLPPPEQAPAQDVSGQPAQGTDTRQFNK
jgi:hypothetical protein